MARPDESSDLPDHLPSRAAMQYAFQRQAVVYGTTSAFLWVVWMLSGGPGGLPGVTVTADQTVVTAGMFPAFFMALGLPGVVRRAWETFVPKPDDAD